MGNSEGMDDPLPQLRPPERLLCGPGPTNVDPAVLEAMTRPMLGHLDPTMHEILLDVVDLLRRVYRMPDGLVLPLQCTGTAGMETGVTNLLEPGDTVIIAQCGFFGRRITEIARRHGAEVVTVDADWGECVTNEALLEALDRHPDARMVAVVHAETSTGVEHPVAELGAALRDRDTLLMVDCVTSLAGVPLEVGDWGVDFAYSCTQKCLAAPPGMSPIAVSERALERVRSRSTPVPFNWDLELLERYWVERPAAYHHTAPILHIYALHEALSGVLREGLEARWARHAEAGAHLRDAIEARGLELLADAKYRLAPLTAVRVPEGVDGTAVQGRLLRDHGIEIGGGLGPEAPSMWRIGLMGRNATVETADRVLEALDAALAAEGAPVAARSG
jgi:alanine-glyoxylate transaminase / serine-glyoxylate transaminase / serine-pyruvate transaminase